MATMRIVLLMTTAIAIGAFLCSADLLPKPKGRDANRCHAIHYADNCTSYSQQIVKDFKISAWSYHPTSKTCRPVFNIHDGNFDCTKNKDLPKSREECESLCGQSCIMGNDELGVCMWNAYCNVTSTTGTDHKQCGYKVNCCPRIPDSSLTLTNGTEYFIHHRFVSTVVTNSTNNTYYYNYVIPGDKNMNSQ